MLKSALQICGIVTLFVGIALAQELSDKRGMEVFRSKCKICHAIEPLKGDEKAKLLGPPIDDVMLRVKEEYPISIDAVAFIVDYIFNPTIRKALCPSIATYGLMPSMKNKLSKKDAEAVAKMLVKRFPR